MIKIHFPSSSPSAKASPAENTVQYATERASRCSRRSTKMAEVFGIVASSLSFAQVTGSIFTNSLKVKALLDEFRDAPESLRETLHYIQVLTPMLSEVNHDESGIAACAPTQSSCLQTALAMSRTAAQQLNLLATELKSEIDRSRGGLRRKRAMVKVVLKKSALEKCELRLQRTIQLVGFAQRNYMM